MQHPILQLVEEKAKKANPPQFEIGDTVTVNVRIVEGDKERTQPYTGVVIARRGKGMGETFIVRRIVNNEGVERVFPLHSPALQSVTVKRSGETRRAKLYFLRDRVGKAVRLVEKRRTPGKGAGEAESGTQSQEPALAGA